MTTPTSTPVDLDCGSQQGGKRNAEVDPSPGSFSTFSRGSRGLVRSSRATYPLAVTRLLVSSEGRLHRSGSSLPVGTYLGLRSAILWVRSLWSLLRRSLCLPLAALALALLADQHQRGRRRGGLIPEGATGLALIAHRLRPAPFSHPELAIASFKIALAAHAVVEGDLRTSHAEQRACLRTNVHRCDFAIGTVPLQRLWIC
jgi:hypothetical protein